MSKSDDRTSTGGVTPGYEDAPAAGPVGPSGQHSSYWILSEEERAKGFVRPVRRTYAHVGPSGPSHPTRELTEMEKERFGAFHYVLFEAYPESDSGVTGRYWTQEQLDRVKRGGCGTTTTMTQSIAETYAARPSFYGATFCVRCGAHLPVGPNGEFVWVDKFGQRTAERVGT